MKRIFNLVILCILLISGCSLWKPFVKDIDGWDLTACADRKGFEVCKELFLDNQEKIFGGQKAINLILENLNQRTEIMALENQNYLSTNEDKHNTFEIP